MADIISKEEQRLRDIRNGDTRALARAISLIENGIEDYRVQLAQLPASDVPVIGVTGPPGVGKSTLVDALIAREVADGKRVAVLCVDPTSAIYFGALLGDRIRMSEWYNHPDVFIRSLSTRGTLGGLHPNTIEIADLLKTAKFDSIIVETVGVGQNEVEIAALADTTLVVLAPEGGDDIQSMKAGLLEIADIFVVNKSDRPGADSFISNLRAMQSPAFRRQGREIPIVKTVAFQRQGIDELSRLIREAGKGAAPDRYRLLAERAYLLIREERMKGISKKELVALIEAASQNAPFNLYRFVLTLSSRTS
ncbi:MAG TPA: methylmalonyl Co-A mutase-associated GTPase MeaB [Puia sp.]|nr:methylmalonyl Co-A mutase-associated GTPase MeaB [Puia sp.]